MPPGIRLKKIKRSIIARKNTKTKILIDHILPFPYGGRHVIRDYFSNTVVVEHDTEYKRNNLGFREERDIGETNDGLVAIGCSYTEGTGVDHFKTWPKLLQNKIGTHVFNLGLGGAGFDNFLQLTVNNLQRFTGKYVFLVFFNYHRFNLPTNKGYLNKDDLVLFRDKAFNVFFDDMAILYNYKVKLLALESACRMHNKILIPLDIRDVLKQRELHWIKGADNPFGPAKDYKHFGDDFHVRVAELMYNSYIKLNK